MHMTRQWVVTGAVVASLAAWWLVDNHRLLPARAQEAYRTVDVTIHDYTFKLQPTVLKVHEPVRIVLRNTDAVQHGFTSEALDGLDVRVESDGIITYGRGIKGLYIDPGHEVEVAFTPTKSGALKFRCDLHPKMKGELAVLTVGAA